MPYKFSNCICLQHPAQENILEFYSRVLGVPRVDRGAAEPELDAAPFRFFVDKGEPRELVLELLVPDLKAARAELTAEGFRVIRWGGKGKANYLRDPFGTLFNLWEDPKAFEK